MVIPFDFLLDKRDFMDELQLMDAKRPTRFE
jgi:hypothetical protein